MDLALNNLQRLICHKTQQQTDKPAIFDTLFSQILIFFQLMLMCPVEIFFKRGCQLNKENFLNLTNQMTIPGCWVINATSVGNTKWCSKSVATCQSMQPSSNDDLCIFLCKSFKIFPSLKKLIPLLVILFRALLAVSQHIYI